MTMEMRRLAAEIAGIKREIRGASTTQQLAYSSIEDGGHIKVFDTGGKEVMTIGKSPDGSYGSNVRVGPPPPIPSSPVMIPTPAGMTVRWDGKWTDSLMAPDDFTRVEVHLSTDPNMSTEFATTLVGTIESPRGGDVVVTKLQPETTYYAAMVARNTAGGRGPASVTVSGISLAPLDGPGTAAATQAASDARLSAEEAARRAAEAKAAADAASTEANAANQSAVDAMAKADVALTTADGLHQIFYSSTDPDSGQGKDGDTWYKRDSTNTMKLLGRWEKLNGVWEPRVITNEMIDTLSAAKITTDTLSAGTEIRTGDSVNGDVYTSLGQSSLQVRRKATDVPVGEDPWHTTINIGGLRDEIQIIDQSTGSQIAGFNADGNGMAGSFNAGVLNVGGSSIGNMFNRDDILFQMPYGRIAAFRMTKDSPKIGGTSCGIAEVAATCYPYRVYRATFTGNMLCSTSGVYRLFMYVTSDGTMPTVSSSQLTMGYFYGQAGMPMRATISAEFFVSGSDPTIDKTTRVLLAAQKPTDGDVFFYSDSGSTPGLLTIDDIGPNSGASSEVWDDGQYSIGGGTPATTNTTTTVTPTVVKKTYTKSYSCSWTAAWNGSSKSSSDELRQGQLSGADWRSAMGFNPQMQSDIIGSTVTKVQLYLYARHWYNDNGGAAKVGAHSAASEPASLPVTQTASPVSWKWDTKGGGQWLTLPSTWYPYFASGAYRGITLGTDITSSPFYYGRFSGYGMSYPPVIKITYVK